MSDAKNKLKGELPPAVFWGIIACVILIVALVAYLRFLNIQQNVTTDPPSDKKKITVPQFVNPELVRHQTRFNFTYDPPEVLFNFRQAEQLDDVVEDSPNEFDAILSLLHWAHKQWPHGTPDPYPPINAEIILEEIRSGRTGGFCAQYNYVLVQALQSFGSKARYLTIEGHEVCEVWVNQFNKWICLDPYVDAYYVDASGVPLSVYDIYKSLKNKKPVTVISDNNGQDWDAHLQQFSRFSVWLKNNHISSPINFTDILRYKVFFYETPDEISNLPMESLVTSYVEDIYFNPNPDRINQ